MILNVIDEKNKKIYVFTMIFVYDTINLYSKMGICNNVNIKYLRKEKSMDNIFKVISDVNRLRIINLLIKTDELCVCELTGVLQISQSNLSKNLKKLLNEEIISREKDLKFNKYKINKDFIDENRQLFDYLEYKFKTSDLYIDDTKVLRRYLKSEFKCSDFTNKYDEIIKEIFTEGEVNE